MNAAATANAIIARRGKPADDFARLPAAFRWIPSEELELPFSEYVREEGRARDRRLQPDAVLEDPAKTHTPQSPGTWTWAGVYGNCWFVDPQLGLSVLLMSNTAVTGMLGEVPNAIRDAVYASL